MAFLQRKRVDLSTLFSKDKHSDFHTKEYGNPFFWIFVFLLCFPLVLFIVYPTLLLFIRAFQGDNGFAVFSDVLQRYRLAFWNSIESSFFCKQFHLRIETLIFKIILFIFAI